MSNKLYYITHWTIFVFILVSACGASKESAVCLKHIELLQDSPTGYLFQKANANIPRDLSLERVFNSIYDFDACLSIQEHINGTLIQGKYCTMMVTIPRVTVPELANYVPDNKTLAEIKEYAIKREDIKTTYRIDCKPFDYSKNPPWRQSIKTASIGVCVPRTCSAEDALPYVMGQRSFRYGDQPVHQLSFDNQPCRVHTTLPLTTADYAACIIFGIIIVFSIISTIYDVKQTFFHKSGSKQNRLYRSFSIYNNTRRLTGASAVGEVRCVHGIRALSIAWEIAGHVNRTNVGFLEDQWSDVKHYFYETGLFVVDTFFLLSGFFVVYTTIRKYNTESFIKTIPKYYLNRLLRLYPTMIAVLLLEMSVLNHFRESYRMNESPRRHGCTELWWTVMLFINNIVFECDANTGFTKFCLHHAWYLAVDMQLYLISPLILVWLFGKKILAWIVLCVAFLSSLIVCSALVFNLNFPYLMRHSLMDLDVYFWFEGLYCNTLIRAPPYFVGMMLGYLLHCLKGTKIQLNKYFLWTMWTLALMIFVTSFYITKEMIYTYNQMLNNFLTAYQRTFWSLAVSWVIFACHTGYGGPVNWLLSLNIWPILTRLSYSMYLVHVPLANLLIFINNGISISYASAWIDFQRFAGLYMITFLVAVIIAVLVEIPVMNLQSVMQTPRNNKIAPETENIAIDMKSNNTSTRHLEER